MSRFSAPLITFFFINIASVLFKAFGAPTSPSMPTTSPMLPIDTIWTVLVLIFLLGLIIHYYAVPIPPPRARTITIEIREPDFYVAQEEANLKFDDFTLGEMIGEGRFGETYLCHQRDVPNSEGVIRILENVVEVDANVRTMEDYLFDEIEVQGNFENQAVLGFLSYFYEGTRIYLLLERPLMQLSEVVLLSRLEVLENVLLLIFAVQAARQARVALRRITIDRLFLNIHGMITIADFGWCIREEREEQDEVVDCADIKIVAAFLISKLEVEWTLASSFVSTEHSTLVGMLNHAWCQEDRMQLAEASSQS